MGLTNKFKGILAALLCTSVVTACSSNTDDNKSSANESITVTDATGEVTIPANATNILAPNAEDSLVTLGVTPVAQWAISGDVKDYLQDSLGDVSTIEWDVPLEQAIEAEPDLIIFSSESAVPTGQLEEYQKIAPTYIFKDADFEDWRTQLTVLGEVLGKEDEAAKAIEEYDELADSSSEEIKEAIGDDSVAAMWVIGGQYYLMENNRYASNVLYSDLGLTEPTMIEEMGSAEGTTWSPVTIEALSDLDADHVFLIASEGEEGITTLEKSSLWNALPAAQKDQVYVIDMDDSWTVNGKIASEKVIEKVKELVIK